MSAKKQNLYETFGKHLTIDAYQCSKAVLADMEKLYTVLDELPQSERNNQDKSVAGCGVWGGGMELLKESNRVILL